MVEKKTKSSAMPVLKAKSKRQTIIDKSTKEMTKTKEKERTNSNKQKKTLIELDKPQRINWEVIGLSSAAITLFGAGLLFMMGWTYEANWYSYFGINISERDIQSQYIFIQSIPGLVTLLACLIAGVFFHMLFINTVPPIRTFLKLAMKPHHEVNHESQVAKPQILLFIPSDWALVLIWTELFQLCLLYFIYEIAMIQQSISRLYELLYLETFLMSGILLIFGALILSAGILLPMITLSFLILIIRKTTLNLRKLIGSFRNKKLEDIGEPTINLQRLAFSKDKSKRMRVPQLYSLIVFEVFVVILTTLAIIAMYAINDARRGVHTGGASIKPMILLNVPDYQLADSATVTSDEENFKSEPFGLISVDDSTYILIRWEKDSNGYFNNNPGLYYVPRNENIYLIPYGQSFQVESRQNQP